MSKNLKPCSGDDFTISFDAAAFHKAGVKAIQDMLSGRMTVAEARKFNREQGDVLKRVELVMKYGQMAKRASKLNWK